MQNAMIRALDIGSSVLSTVVRLGAGLSARPCAKQPAKLLELYEFEACPFCRKVREALTTFDLDATIYPCPKNGTRFRPKAIELGGKPSFPLLVDPNTGTHLYESLDIIRYLARTYDAPSTPLLLGPLSTMSGGFASAVRGSRGMRARGSKAPAQPLELWSFEGSPFSRIVRERLCELEIPYVLHNVGKGSLKREAFIARSGKMQVPYLVDANTGAAMFESAEIVRYLTATYGAS
jgi:glutathione S-transferase